MLQLPAADGPRVLEVGCGFRARAVEVARQYVGIDSHQPYIDQAQADHPGQTFLCSSWGLVMPRLRADSFDAVYAIDFIEHLTRKSGMRFLRQAKRIAAQVVIFTPAGPMKQVPGEGEPESQRHRSAWRPRDFPGWAVTVLPRFHGELADGTPLAEPIGAFWAVWRRTDSSGTTPRLVPSP